MDKIDELCIKGEFYQYDEKLKKQLRIIEVLENFVGAFKKNEVYALWPHGKGLEYLDSLVPGKLVIATEEDWKTGMIKGLLVNAGLKRKYKCIIVSTYSNKWKRKFKVMVLSCMNRCKVVDIYELLEKGGVKVEKDFQFGFGLIHEDIISNLKAYEKEGMKDENKKIKVLIADYLAIRDFKNAFKYIDKLESLGDSDINRYISLKKEIEIYLEELKQKIKEKEHVVVNWIDALRYDEMQNMSFVCEQARRGICFQNMYVNAPYTAATLKTLFTGKMLIDDKLYEMPLEACESGKLYQVLQKYDYQFVYVSSYYREGIFRNDRTQRGYCFNDRIEIPCSWVQYELIRSLAYAEKKCFAIAHTFGEIHYPHMNPVDKEIKPINDPINIFREGDNEKIKGQIISSQQYVDEQLRYYHQFYESVPYEIYMSDHGEVRKEEYSFFRNLYHTIFCVLGNNISPISYSKVSSLQMFPEIVNKILEGKAGEITEIYKKEYVLIQRDDKYNFVPGRELYYLHNPEEYKLFNMQYRGVVTEKDCYVRNMVGDEYYLLGESGENLIENEEYADRITFLRQIAGNRFINIEKVKKYNTSNKLYKQLGFNINEDVKYVE